MQNPRKLQIWHKARVLVVHTYRVTAQYPDEERFALVQQMRRAAVSVGSNISEGSGRQTDKEFAAALQHAMASASELEFQTISSADLRMADGASLSALEDEIVELKKMISRFIIYLRSKKARP